MPELTGYNQVNLSEMISELGAERVTELLASFSCPYNQDIEHFLKSRAIAFSNQGIAATHLVYTSYKGEPVLVGYYALANKVLTVRATANLHGKLRSRISRFSKRNNELRQYELSIPLIGQLSKNFSNGYNQLITGSDLLEMAFARIRTMQLCVGGRFAYLECADKPKLVHFYEDNGFVFLDKRVLQPSEIGLDGCQYYMQMIKYF